jgi:hypothetical protein
MPNGRVFDYVGEIYTDYVFPAAGTYVFQVRAYGTQGSVTHQRPSVAFKVDGQQMGKPITIGGDQRNTAVSSTAAVKVSAGQHRISLAFLNGPTKDELTAAIATVAAAKAAAATRPGAVSTSATTNPSASGQSRGGQGQGQGQEQANGASRQGNPAAQPPLGLPASAAGNNSSGAGGGTAPVVASAQTSNTTAQNGPATAPVGVNGQRGGANGAGANGLGANGRNGAAGANGRGAAGGRGRGGGPPPPVLSPTGKPTLGVVYFEVEGPQEVSLDRMPDSYKKVFVALPSATVTKEQAARQIITNFAAKAYRRPARTEEVDRLMAYWSQIDRSGETFDKSIDAALQPVLASPNFLYRVEAQPSASDPGGIRTLNEYELASRLSYFLWSSMPDDELFNLAHDGKLRANLEPQVRRMMASPKSFAMVQNFAGQWLQLRQMENVTPDPKRFPEFDESLRDAMVKETQLYFSAIMTEDRSVLDFIDSDFTFMNEQLAKLYGRTDIKGDEFRRVALTGDQRGGVITQASVLTITSFPNRTSPVIRGKWVLENLLDEAPPPPPPDVPKLAETTQAEMTGTLRQRMETHRNNPNCVSCHAQMDPIGFGLENYDAIGAWRDNDTNNQVIDASGVLPDGTKFSGAGELKKILLDQKDQFCRCLTDRMMTFALGRGMEGYDRPMVNKIAAGLKDKDYKFSALILQIVESDAFQQLGSSAK